MAKAKRHRNQKFLLASALVPNSTFRPAVLAGMGAFLASHRQLIAIDQRPRIGDSLDLDEALRPAFPNAHRWDYVFSVSDAKKLIALEPHSAKDDEIRVVIAKKKHAAEHLRNHLEPKYSVSEWLWVSSGGTRFSKMDKTTRQLAQEGIRYVGKALSSFG